MQEEKKEQEIKRIEVEIEKDLREVETLEEKLESLTGDNHDHHHEHSHHEVEVTVDNKKHKIKLGSYVVSKFKQMVGVPAAKVLDEVIHGELKQLDDNATLHIKGCEIFISHVKSGGSSR